MSRTALGLVTVLVTAACSGGGSLGDENTATTDVSASSTTVAEQQGEPLFAGVDGAIELSTPTEGEGIRPLLAWEPVDGADHYAVFLYAPDGQVYWSWTGYSTEIHVGGEPKLRDGATGPSVVEGMTWAVIAYDADLLPIAVSAVRPIAP